MLWISFFHVWGLPLSMILPFSLLHLPLYQVFPILKTNAICNAISQTLLSLLYTHLEWVYTHSLLSLVQSTLQCLQSVWLLSTILDWTALPVVINGLLIVKSNSILSVITLDLSPRPCLVWPKANTLASFPIASPLLTTPQLYQPAYCSANKLAELFYGLCMWQCLCL